MSIIGKRTTDYPPRVSVITVFLPWSAETFFKTDRMANCLARGRTCQSHTKFLFLGTQIEYSSNSDMGKIGNSSFRNVLQCKREIERATLRFRKTKVLPTTSWVEVLDPRAPELRALRKDRPYNRIVYLPKVFVSRSIFTAVLLYLLYTRYEYIRSTINNTLAKITCGTTQIRALVYNIPHGKNISNSNFKIWTRRIYTSLFTVEVLAIRGVRRYRLPYMEIPLRGLRLYIISPHSPSQPVIADDNAVFSWNLPVFFLSLPYFYRLFSFLRWRQKPTSDSQCLRNSSTAAQPAIRPPYREAKSTQYVCADQSVSTQTSGQE